MQRVVYPLVVWFACCTNCFDHRPRSPLKSEYRAHVYCGHYVFCCLTREAKQRTARDSASALYLRPCSMALYRNTSCTLCVRNEGSRLPKIPPTKRCI